MPTYQVVEVHEQIVRWDDVDAADPEAAADEVGSMDISACTYRSDLDLQYTLVFEQDGDDRGKLVYDSREEDAGQRQHDIAVTAAINEALKEQGNDRH